MNEEQLAKIEAEHVKTEWGTCASEYCVAETSDGNAMSVSWPCLVSTLIAEVRRLQGSIFAVWQYLHESVDELTPIMGDRPI